MSECQCVLRQNGKLIREVLLCWTVSLLEVIRVRYTGMFFVDCCCFSVQYLLIGALGLLVVASKE